jgi:predicted RNA binding protein YcfA (HicA-like mRNA interferase family)
MLMPRKVRELIQDLDQAGFYEIKGGKGSHRKFTHANYAGAVTLSGKTGSDAKPYQEKQVRQAIEKCSAMKSIDQYHKWVEWSEEDQIYIGKCPDLITGIHGEDPVVLYRELCQVVGEVIDHFNAQGRALPDARIRPMQEVI